MKKEYKIFGFIINTKNFLITMGVAVVVLAVLLFVHFIITPVSWYGMLIGVAFLVALVIACDFTRERNLPKDYPYDLILWIFPLAIIGARLGYVLNSPGEFSTFLDAFKFWEGGFRGLSILGGTIGGVIGIAICCFIKKKDVLSACDIAAPVLILGQCIGRWGNFINVELYGQEITATWLQWFPVAVNVNGHWYMALFFYESILNFAGFILLTILLRKTNIKGIVASGYLMFYGLVRSLLEMLRQTQYILYIPGTNIPFSVVTSVIFFLIGTAGLVTLLILNKKKPEWVQVQKRRLDTEPVVETKSK